MDIAYFRGVLNRKIYWEYVNGCPSILVGSEPTMVVKRGSVGNLIVYLHFKNWEQKKVVISIPNYIMRRR